jgi:hypothetical protein
VYNDKGDMPPLEMFPKSQRVTFKFYEGVLLFLEENYIKVRKSAGHSIICANNVRPRYTSMKHGSYVIKMLSPNLSKFWHHNDLEHLY